MVLLPVVQVDPERRHIIPEVYPHFTAEGPLDEGQGPLEERTVDGARL